MADSTFSLEEDLSCSICCDLFREPVLLGCGHSFCHECLSGHWTVTSGRPCPVCRTPSPRLPIPNISLRKTCMSLLQQRRRSRRRREMNEEEEEEDEGRLCPQHGQELALFCEKDEELICSVCKITMHRFHQVLPVMKAVKERKERLAAAVKPLRVRLDNLMYGSADCPLITEQLKTIVEKCETQIRGEFEKLFAFLREEQKSHLEELRGIGNRETQLAKNTIKAEVTPLSRRVQKVEEMAQKDDITFLKEFKTVMASMQLSPEPVQCLWDAFDVHTRLGNLRFNVLKKMERVVPFYPVVLDPSNVPGGVTISDDLTTVTAIALQQQVPLQNCSSMLVVGAKAFDNDDCHVWDVHVGDSKDWVVGVTSQRHIGDVFPLSPDHGFWAIQRKQNEYFALTSPPTTLTPGTPPPYLDILSLGTLTRPSTPIRHVQTLRVELLWTVGRNNEESIRKLRRVKFSDAKRQLKIFSFNLNNHRGALYPFLCPLGRGSKLRVEPAKVKVEVRKTLGNWDNNWPEIILFGFVGCIGFVFYLFIIIKSGNGIQR